jgi:mycothiol system anti-sigma-R factor
MMRCEHVLARLWEYLDGELPSAEDTAVRKHLEVCAECYPKYNFQRAYLEYARRIREKEHAPPELRRRLFQRLLVQDRDGDALT